MRRSREYRKRSWHVMRFVQLLTVAIVVCAAGVSGYAWSSGPGSSISGGSSGQSGRSGGTGGSESQASEAASGVATATAPAVISGDTWHDTGPTQISEMEGPSSGRILSVAVAPDSSTAGAGGSSGASGSNGSGASGETLYIGSAGGGLWKSTDDGNHWTPLTDNQPSLAVSAIAIDPQNPQVIYAGTGGLVQVYSDAFFGDGILKSTDGGKHWTTLGQSTFGHHTIHSLVVSPSNPSTLFVGDDMGIYRSTDGGKTWTHVWSAGQNEQVDSISMDPSHPQRMYATGQALPVLESTDGGKTWQIVNLPGAPLGTFIYAGYVAVAPSSPQTVYDYLILGNQKKSAVWVSHDSGKTWKREAIPTVSIFPQDWTQRFGTLGVDPSHPQHLFIGGQNLAESTDGGKTWSVMLYQHPDDHAVAFDPSGNAFFGTDGGMWEQPTGADMKDINGNLSITQFYPGMSLSQDQSALLGGTQDNGTVTMMLGAWKEWEPVVGGDGGYTVADYAHPTMYYLEVLMPGHSVIRMDLSGSTPSVNVTPHYQTKSAVSWVEPIATRKDAPKSVLVGGDRVYESADEGKTWQAISPHWPGDTAQTISGIHITALAWPTDNIIYAGTDTGEVYATQNGGKTWHNLKLPITSDVPDEITSISVVPGNNKGIVVTLGEGTELAYHYPNLHANVFSTQDAFAGATPLSLVWQDLTGNLPRSPIESSLFVNGKLLVGTDHGVYETTLDGAAGSTAKAGSQGSPGQGNAAQSGKGAAPKTTWSLLHKGLPNAPVVSMVVAKGSLYAATSGRGVWETKLNTP